MFNLSMIFRQSQRKGCAFCTPFPQYHDEVLFSVLFLPHHSSGDPSPGASGSFGTHRFQQPDAEIQIPLIVYILQISPQQFFYSSQPFDQGISVNKQLIRRISYMHLLRPITDQCGIQISSLLLRGIRLSSSSLVEAAALGCR